MVNTLISNNTFFVRPFKQTSWCKWRTKIVPTSLAEALRKLAAATSQRIVGIQYLKQKTIRDVVRRAVQLRWMHQHVPQQPDYYQVCMEWYDFRLIKTVITVSSAFHNVNIKIYGVPRVRNRHNSKRMRNTGEKKRKVHAQSKRCIRSECAYMIYTILLLFARKTAVLQQHEPIPNSPILFRTEYVKSNIHVKSKIHYVTIKYKRWYFLGE